LIEETDTSWWRDCEGHVAPTVLMGKRIVKSQHSNGDFVTERGDDEWDAHVTGGALTTTLHRS